MAIDRTGERYGRLVVVELAEPRVRRVGNGWIKYVYWKCKCDCGEIKEVESHKLPAGQTNSCGCLRRERCAQLGRDLHAGKLRKQTSET